MKSSSLLLVCFYFLTKITFPAVNASRRREPLFPDDVTSDADNIPDRGEFHLLGGSKAEEEEDEEVNSGRECTVSKPFGMDLFEEEFLERGGGLSQKRRSYPYTTSFPGAKRMPKVLVDLADDPILNAPDIYEEIERQSVIGEVQPVAAGTKLAAAEKQLIGSSRPETLSDEITCDLGTSPKLSFIEKIRGLTLSPANGFGRSESFDIQKPSIRRGSADFMDKLKPSGANKIPNLIKTSPKSHKIALPLLCKKDEYYHEFADALLGKYGRFVDVLNFSFGMMAGQMSSAGLEPKMGAVLAQVEKFSSNPRLSTLVQDLHRWGRERRVASESEPELDLEEAIYGVRTKMLNAIGYESSLSNEDKMASFPQRTIITPLNVFPYPGMLRLIAFFDARFDPMISTTFSHLFATDLLKGLYGPMRCNLPYITRFEDIPSEALADATLDTFDAKQQPKSEEKLRNDQEFVDSVRERFLNPLNRQVILEQFPDISMRPLNPVPKTVEDVIEGAVALVLYRNHQVNRRRNRFSFATSGESKKMKDGNLALEDRLLQRAHQPALLDAVQSFFLGNENADLCFTFDEVEYLIEFLVFSSGPRGKLEQYRECHGEFVIAAALMTLMQEELALNDSDGSSARSTDSYSTDSSAASGTPRLRDNFSKFMSNLIDLYNLRFNKSNLNRIHLNSINEAERILDLVDVNLLANAVEAKEQEEDCEERGSDGESPKSRHSIFSTCVEAQISHDAEQLEQALKSFAEGMSFGEDAFFPNQSSLLQRQRGQVGVYGVDGDSDED